MSALRISRPGIVGTTLVDLGPAMGRVQHTRGAITGGMLVVAESERTRGKRLQRELVARQRAAAPPAPKCGKWMPIVRETCGRGPNHRDSCRSAIVMADESKRRSSRRDRSEARRA